MAIGDRAKGACRPGKEPGGLRPPYEDAHRGRTAIARSRDREIADARRASRNELRSGNDYRARRAGGGRGDRPERATTTAVRRGRRRPMARKTSAGATVTTAPASSTAAASATPTIAV